MNYLMRKQIKIKKNKHNQIEHFTNKCQEKIRKILKNEQFILVPIAPAPASMERPLSKGLINN